MSNFISTHWGTYKFSVDKNQKLSLTNWDSDPSPTEFGLGLADAVTDDLRTVSYTHLTLPTILLV